MAKFNETINQTEKKAETTNLAGGVAYKYEDARKELASVILSSMVNGNSYYESESDRINRIIGMVAEGDSEFAAKAAVYVRNEGNLRTVSHIMGAILAENVKGTDYLRSALTKTIVRPDDAMEMVALFNTRNKGKMIPNSLRRAIKDVFESKFDEYQLKKYSGGSGKIKLRDIVKLARPNPETLVAKGKAKDTDVFKRLIEGTLENIVTAQTVNAQSTGESRAQNYFSMLIEGKLGYMAGLKNLKNILETLDGFDQSDRQAMITKLSLLFRNEKACRKSMVLPFRFIQAAEAVEAMSFDRILQKELLDGIEAGFIISAKNIPIVDEGESVALLLDESGSMGSSGWGSSATEMSPFKIGKILMASMLVGLDKTKTLGYLWADNARRVDISGSPFDFIKRTNTQGYGTNLNASMADLVKTKTFVDKIVILTDMQSNSLGSFKQAVTAYRKINPNVKILFWNLQGYGGDTPMKLSNDILEVSGFSDKMLSVIPKMWKNSNALIDEILAIKL